MKTAAALLALILLSPAAYADSSPARAAQVAKAPLPTKEQSQKSDKGAFRLELVLGGEVSGQCADGSAWPRASDHPGEG